MRARSGCARGGGGTGRSSLRSAFPFASTFGTSAGGGRSHSQRTQATSSNSSATPSVRRSVMADDYVYAISDAGVRVAHVSNLAAPVATANFAPEFNFYP